MNVLRGFKNFLMQGDVVVVAVGLVIALAFSTLVKAFTDSIITPLVNAIGGSGANGLGFTVNGQRVEVGVFIAALIYFIIFMFVIYFLIVVPYRHYRAHRGGSAFSEPGPVKTCPECLSDDIPAAARKCRYCGSEQPVVTAA